jgi:dienelactone hydrolase
LGAEAFSFERVARGGGNRLKWYDVRFRSPVETPHRENNTVHAELFRPEKGGPFPCVLVLHIAGGDFRLSRFLASSLAYRGVAALFVHLPYYGERRPKGVRVRMLSMDLDLTVHSMRQAVLDLRRACDWIAGQPDLDGRRIGLLGTSLGSLVGGLAIAIEPRIDHGCLILGGARLDELIWHSTEPAARELREAWEKTGKTKQHLAELVRPIDPATYADRLQKRNLLLIEGAYDDVMPRVCCESLWEASGQARCVWHPCGHYSVLRYSLQILQELEDYFLRWPAHRLPPAAPPPTFRRESSLVDFVVRRVRERQFQNDR